MTWKVLIALGFLVTHGAFAQEPEIQSSCGATNSSLPCVRFLRNYDGDTFTVNISYVHPLLGDQITVRVNGIDAPEIGADKACERQAAFKAQQEVEKILASARRIDLKNVQRDKYFRVLAEVRVDGKSLSEHMLQARLAVPYDGGHKEDTNWCKR